VAWKKKDWWRTNKERAANVDLWEQLLRFCEKHQVERKARTIIRHCRKAPFANVSTPSGLAASDVSAAAFAPRIGNTARSLSRAAARLLAMTQPSRLANDPLTSAGPLLSAPPRPTPRLRPPAADRVPPRSQGRRNVRSHRPAPPAPVDPA